MKFKWEIIDFRKEEDIRTCRAKVIGGWVLRTETWSKFSQSESSVFISDPNHEWTIEE